MDQEMKDALTAKLKPASATPPPSPASTGDAPPPPAVPPASQGTVVIPPSLLGVKDTPPPVVVTPPPDGEHKELSDDEIARLPRSQQNPIRNQREKIRQQAKVIADLQAKSGATSTDPEEIKKLRDEHANALNELERVALERSPRFNAKYEQAKQVKLDRVKNLMKEFGVEADKLDEVAEKAAGMPIKERLNYLSQQSPEIAPTLFEIYSGIDELDRAKAKELSDARTAGKNYQAEQAEAVKQFKGKYLASSLEAAQKNGHILLQEIPGNEEWNTAVKANRQLVEQVFASEDLSVQSNALVLGALAPVYLGVVRSQAQAIKDLQDQLAKYGRAMPRIGGDAPPSDTPTKPANGRMSSSEAGKAAARLAGL